MEDVTSLSIIDPVTINIEVNDHSIRNADVNIANFSLRSQHFVEVIVIYIYSCSLNLLMLYLFI